MTKPLTVKELKKIIRNAPDDAEIRVQVVHDLDCIIVEHGPIYSAKVSKRKVLLSAADDIS